MRDKLNSMAMKPKHECAPAFFIGKGVDPTDSGDRHFLVQEVI